MSNAAGTVLAFMYGGDPEEYAFDPMIHPADTQVAWLRFCAKNRFHMQWMREAINEYKEFGVPEQKAYMWADSLWRNTSNYHLHNPEIAAWNDFHDRVYRGLTYQTNREKY